MKRIIFIVLLFFVVSIVTKAQEIAPNTYVIQFKDKKDSKYSVDKPEEFLSKRAIERRKRYNIALTEQDIPVNKEYVKKIEDLGFKIYAVSKWFNHVVVYSEDSKLLDKVQALDFVKVAVKKAGKKESEKIVFEKLDIDPIVVDSSFLDYGSGKSQNEMLNIQFLHNNGFRGQGMHIAILDAGFKKADQLPSFDSLRTQNRILGIKDFVARDGDVYKDDSHGMMVLSCMAGWLPGKLIGTAPEAKYWLIRTEEEASEYIVEEYYWISGAEFADSVGVDLINTSLGYNDFDDGVNSHEYKDMTGDISPISIAADIASSKGILVVTSAGNEGNDEWHYITSPADADSVLTVGSVTSSEYVSGFSSRGYTPDGRIKPDVMAQGSWVYVQGTGGGITFSNGTSFSGPIMAGAVACLWQANKGFSNMEIIEAVKRSSDRCDKPNENFGYGIPDMSVADIYLKMKLKEKIKNENEENKEK